MCGVTSYQYSITITFASAKSDSIATTIISILLVVFCHDNASLIVFSQLLSGYTLSRILQVGLPSFQPRWFQGLIDTGSRCNQFFISHQCCVQGAATWLKVKDVSGGSTGHEL